MTNQDAQPAPLLDLQGLCVAFRSSTGLVPAVREVDLQVYPGQSVAIVGESGSGKSTTAMAVLGLLPPNGQVTEGTVRFDGEDITGWGDAQMAKVRGSLIGLVPQDPMSNLNPVWTIGSQVKESLRAHRVVPRAELDQRTEELLAESGLPDPGRQAKQYPHEFSGGMRQRALIAMGLAARPKLLIADEPTSALDVTVQRRILDHLGGLTRDLGTAVLFITHDLGLAAERAEHIVVMHRGRVVEAGPSLEVLRHPRHPYTRRLVDAAPSLASAREVAKTGTFGGDAPEAGERAVPAGENASEDIIRVAGLTKVFPARGRGARGETVRAVDNVDLRLRRGSTLGVVGESGSGKSTVASMILGLTEPTSGSVVIDGKDLQEMSAKERFAMRRRVQVVFQNPYGSLDPMYSVFRCIEEPLAIHSAAGRGGRRAARKERERRVAELLDMVALPRSAMRRYPNELSGGQRQRVAIARALALNPDVVVLDEAVSALDVLVQDQILGLLRELQEELRLSYFFITHDLAVVRQMAHDVAVMRAGKVVESGDAHEVFTHPREAYTADLIGSVPGLGLLQ